MEKLTNFINGSAVDSTSGETSSLINPSTGQAYATAPKSNAADVDDAFSAASDAFPGWRDSTPSQRQRALLKIADAIEDRQSEIIAIECRNTGKPISLTTTEEVPPMVDQIRFFAGAARNLEGKSAIFNSARCRCDGVESRHPGNASLAARNAASTSAAFDFGAVAYA